MDRRRWAVIYGKFRIANLRFTHYIQTYMNVHFAIFAAQEVIRGDTKKSKKAPLPRGFFMA